MNQDMMEALQALAQERGITVDALFAALADALESAYKRMPDAYEYAWVTINPDTMEFQVFAQELDDDGEPIGEEFEEELSAGGIVGIWQRVLCECREQACEAVPSEHRL